mmetsp:Transcript_59494/g.106125  ORF Transcript_59494/g.106125 Transcript_59494/m.106125 type:complete len:289 (-) Transcript_59494:1925-2791(-)
MQARLRDGYTQTEANGFNPRDASQLQELVTQMEEMSKEMQEEREDLMQIVEPVAKMIKPKTARGSQEQLAIEALEAWKRKRLLQIEKRQALLEQSFYVLKSIVCGPDEFRLLDSAKERVSTSPRRTSIMTAIQSVRNGKQSIATRDVPDFNESVSINRLLGARQISKEVPFANKPMPPNARSFSVVSASRPNAVSGTPRLNLHSLMSISAEFDGAVSTPPSGLKGDSPLASRRQTIVAEGPTSMPNYLRPTSSSSTMRNASFHIVPMPGREKEDRSASFSLFTGASPF